MTTPKIRGATATLGDYAAFAARMAGKIEVKRYLRAQRWPREGQGRAADKFVSRVIRI